jgi:uncharacterized protein involved in exopolysaccharide biosynthesis
MHLSSLLPSGRARWTALIVCSILGALVAVVWTIVRAPVYRAEARLFFKSDKATGGLQLPIAIGLGSNEELNNAAGLLESNSVRLWVKNVMKLEKLEDVDKVIRFETHPEYSQIILAAENEDKAFALKAVTEAHKALQSVSRKTGFSLARDKAASLEAAIAENRRLLAEASRRSADFEKRRRAPTKPDDPGTVQDYQRQAKQAELDLADVKTQLDERLKVIRESGANPNIPSGLPPSKKWSAILDKLEYDLLTAQNTQGPLSPTVQKLKRDIKSAQDQYTQELKAYLNSVNRNLDEEIATLTVQKLVLESRVSRYRELAAVAPDEAIRSMELAREVKARSEVLNGLITQYELAKVDAQVADAKWALVDDPFVLDDPVNKKLGRMGAMGLMIGLAVGLFIPVGRRSRGSTSREV